MGRPTGRGELDVLTPNPDCANALSCLTWNCRNWGLKWSSSNKKTVLLGQVVLGFSWELSNTPTATSRSTTGSTETSRTIWPTKNYSSSNKWFFPYIGTAHCRARESGAGLDLSSIRGLGVLSMLPDSSKVEGGDFEVPRLFRGRKWVILAIIRPIQEGDVFSEGPALSVSDICFYLLLFPVLYHQNCTAKIYRTITAILGQKMSSSYFSSSDLFQSSRGRSFYYGSLGTSSSKSYFFRVRMSCSPVASIYSLQRNITLSYNSPSFSLFRVFRYLFAFDPKGSNSHRSSFISDGLRPSFFSECSSSAS